MTIQNMVAAEKTLKALGWKQLASVTYEEGCEGRFGVLYVKFDQATRTSANFYLNWKTWNNLPK